jgi:adenylate cyclase
MTDTPTAEEVRLELERILGHRDFEAGPRTRRFLEFVVDEALAGRAERLKAYTIAVEVFGRAPDFDANLDPIVRIQAGRLRRALEHYYLVAGLNDPITISVPRGAYVPVFARNDVQPGVSASPEAMVLDMASRRSLGAAVAVLPFRNVVSGAEHDAFGDGLTEELCNELGLYQDLSVTPCWRAALPETGASSPQELARTLGVRFLLDGSVRGGGSQVKISTRLIDGAQGRQVWARGYGRALDPHTLIETQEEIARDVSAAVGGVYGAISRHLTRETRKLASTRLNTHEAILRFYEFETSINLEDGAACLAALQAAVERDPECGPLWGALSVVQGFAYLMDLPGFPDARGRMATYARRGVELAPANQLARAAMCSSHFVLKERDAFLREAEATLELNPVSPFYAGSIGYLLILADEAGQGRALLDRAIAANPHYPRWFNHALCVDDYMKGDYERAELETRKPAFGVYFWGPLLQAAALAQLGRTAEAATAASEVLQLVPDFETRGRDLMSRPILSGTIVDALLDGLRKAGLNLQGSATGKMTASRRPVS